MKKVNIKATIISNGQKIVENTLGCIKNGVISYQENDKTYVYLDVLRDELIRENNYLFLKYKFDDKNMTVGKIEVKEINNYTEIDIKTNKIIKDAYKYYVEYIIEKDEFSYEVDYVEV